MHESIIEAFSYNLIEVGFINQPYKPARPCLTMPMQPNCQAAQFLELDGPVNVVRQRRIVAGLVNRLIGGR